MTKKLFSGQRVLVVGLGLHGGGVAAVQWLHKHGASITVTDIKTRQSLKTSLEKLKGISISYALGGHRVSDFTKADLIVQNPGVPRESRFLDAARKAGVPIENDATLFLKYCTGTVIGVTGTRGKSTTATLTHALLKKEYGKRAWLAGLPGQPMLAILDKVKENDLVVLELSSWQLEVLGEQNLSPDVAVVTNILPDHLNRYVSMGSYTKAKEHIVKHQNKSGIAVLNKDDAAVCGFAKQTKGRVVWFSKTTKIPKMTLPGVHNQYNARGAVTVARLFKVSTKNITTVLQSFKGLPSRFELVRKKAGVSYINDTTATTPDATIAALKQLPKKSAVLIAGGSGKEIPQKKFKELAEVIKKQCKAVILFPGEGSDQIYKPLDSMKFDPVVTNVSSIADTISLAQTFAKRGDTIILSPACASFNMFVNEYDRGEQFTRIIKKL